MITTSEYDLYLGDKSNIRGYRVGSFVRDSAPQVAPRFSTGSEGETSLDLLKATSVSSMVGGMFQRDWTDDTKVARSVGVYNPYNGMFYPAPAPNLNPTSLSAMGTVLAKAEDELYSFIAFGRFVTGSGAGTGYTSKLYKLTKATGTMSQITLPTVYTTNATAFISDLALHKEYLYISTTSTSNYIKNHRYNIAANTFQDMDGSGVIFRALRGTLYHINSQSAIYSVTNETAASSATYTLIDYAGRSDAYVAAPTDAIEFNGALWIAKPDGIFRFDGLKAVRILKLRTQSLQEYNGAIYFVADQWLYKFDGTNVTKLQFFGQEEIVGDLSLASNADYLFIETFTASGTFQATTDKAATASGLRRIYTYDGQAFNILYEFSMSSLPKAPTYGIVYTEDTLFDIYTVPQSASDTADHDIYYNRFDLLDFYKSSEITTSAMFDITTSEFDGGYPNIKKSLNVIELSYRDMVPSDVLTVKYQLFDGKNWGSWITLGTLNYQSDNKLEIVTDSEMLFNRVKVSVTASLAATSTFSFKGLTLRWTLQPRMRWRWTTTLIAHGATDLRYGLPETATANTLNNAITKSMKQKSPIYMLSPDYGVVRTTAAAGATSIEIDGEVPIYSDPYQEYPLVAIKNDSGTWEILKVTAASYDGTKTTLTIQSRGYLGITAAQISAGKEFHLCYRVYITRLNRDSAILDPETYDEQPSKNSQLKREFHMEIIEV